MNYALRMTEAQHAALRAHLFPGDEKEAVALLLCGRRAGTEKHILTLRKLVPIPYGACDRRADRVTWPTDAVDALLGEAYGKGLAIVKVHSHPMDYRRFSDSTTDPTEKSSHPSRATWMMNRRMRASSCFPVESFLAECSGTKARLLPRLAQSWQWGTICGYGRSAGFLIRTDLPYVMRKPLEKAQRTCCARSPSPWWDVPAPEALSWNSLHGWVWEGWCWWISDSVEEKNLNRIVNSGKENAYLNCPKVHALAAAIARMGLNQEVLPLVSNLITPEVVKRVAECDVVFGCMDGVEGRHWLNRLATFYTLPYFDVGVRLDADGNGGIDSIVGAVHYLQPGLSSLLSREVYDMKRVEAEEIRRIDPEMYRRQVKEGYLRGVDEDRPAVISVNMFFAALAVNDFLARLHPYRNLPNAEFAYVGGSLSEMQLYKEGEAEPCAVLRRHVGRGDVSPLLERPALS